MSCVVCGRNLAPGAGLEVYFWRPSYPPVTVCGPRGSACFDVVAKAHDVASGSVSWRRR
jgi:hypothetical protein